MLGLFNVKKEGEWGGVLPLVGVSVAAKVVGFLAEVTTRQSYVNSTASPMECMYRFPVDANANVSGFRILVDSGRRTVVGRVEESEVAMDTYDDSLAEGNGAFLLHEEDENSRDVLRVCVGNLPPGGDAVVEITYVTELTKDDREDEGGTTLPGFRLVVPSVVAPRYDPHLLLPDPGDAAATAVAPPPPPPHAYKRAAGGQEVEATYATSVTVSVQASVEHGGVRQLSSPSHTLAHSTTDEGGRERAMVVTVSSDAGGLGGKDFVLHVEPAEPHLPRGWLETKAGSDAVCCLSLYPDLSDLAETLTNDQGGEFVFVVDRSGSMRGKKIENARECLALCMASLPEGCMFNILGFGSRIQNLNPHSVRFDDATKREALRYLERMQADLGGTNMMPPLQMIAATPPATERPRQVLVFTDGQVRNTLEVVEFVAEQHLQGTRFFAFGIGSGASHALVRGIAERGGGESEFIVEGERIESKVMRQLDRALQPALTDITIDWAGSGLALVSEDSFSPRILPPLFSGSRLLVFGFVDPAASSAAIAAAGEAFAVRVTAKTPDGDLSYAVPVRTSESSGSSSLMRAAAAKAMVSDCERQFDRLRSSSADSVADADMTRQRAISLSCRNTVMSRWTSFVAIERRENPTTAAMSFVQQPPMQVTINKARPHGGGRGGGGRCRGGQFHCLGMQSSGSSSSLGGRAMSFMQSISPAGMMLRSKKTERALPTAPVSLSATKRKSKKKRGGSPAAPMSLSAAAGPARRRVDDFAHSMKHDNVHFDKEFCGVTLSAAAAAGPAFLSMSVDEQEEEQRGGGGPSLLVGIFALQSASGSWALSGELATLLGKPLDQIREAIATAAQIEDSYDGDEAWATAAVLAFIEGAFDDRRDEWQLPARKARKWLRRSGAGAGAAEADGALKRIMAS